jgi:hypothetical protein
MLTAFACTLVVLVWIPFAVLTQSGSDAGVRFTDACLRLEWAERQGMLAVEPYQGQPVRQAEREEAP